MTIIAYANRCVYTDSLVSITHEDKPRTQEILPGKKCFKHDNKAWVAYTGDLDLPRAWYSALAEEAFLLFSKTPPFGSESSERIVTGKISHMTLKWHKRSYKKSIEAYYLSDRDEHLSVMVACHAFVCCITHEGDKTELMFTFYPVEAAPFVLADARANAGVKLLTKFGNWPIEHALYAHMVSRNTCSPPICVYPLDTLVSLEDNS